MWKPIFAAVLTFATLLGQDANQEKKPRMITVTGTFDVKVLPGSETGAKDGFSRLLIDKAFQGQLEGTSRVEMMVTPPGPASRSAYRSRLAAAIPT